jgi:hypothetical protein
MEKADFLNEDTIAKYLKGKFFDRIILSGGEPLSHPDFYFIIMICKKHSNDVIVYSNLITHLVYNANVIDGVYLEANLTVLDDVDKIHILKRIQQGKEKNRPEIKFSSNWTKECDCDKRVMRPNGKLSLHPCNKYKYVEKEESKEDWKKKEIDTLKKIMRGEAKDDECNICNGLGIVSMGTGTFLCSCKNRETSPKAEDDPTGLKKLWEHKKGGEKK